MKKPIMVMSPDWAEGSVTTGRNLLSSVHRVQLQRHIFPFLEPSDLLALYHCSRYLRSAVANWCGWRSLYKRDFGTDAVTVAGDTPFEQYLLRAKAQVYMLWLVPNEKPQIVGPTPQFAIRKICASAQFAVVLATTGELYAIEPKASQPQPVGPRGHRMLKPGDSQLGLKRMRHSDTRFQPKFRQVWGSHSYIHAVSDRNELYMWFSSDMYGWHITFGTEKIGQIQKIVSCSSNNWHAALVDGRILWWTCDYSGHDHNYQPFIVKSWEYYGSDVRDIEIIGSRLLLLLDGQVTSLALGHDGDMCPTEAPHTSFEVPDTCERMGSCLSILTLFCSDKTTLALDVNYPETFLLQDVSNCIDILFRPNSTWKLCADGSVHHWSSYNWANGLLWSPPRVTPLSITSPNSLVLDKTFQWTSPANSTRQPIVLDPNAIETMCSHTETTSSIFMHRVLQIAHQYTQHSLSLHLVLVEPSPGDVFSSSILHGDAQKSLLTRKSKLRNSLYVESEPKRESWISKWTCGL